MVGASSHYHSQFFHLRRLYAWRKLLNEGPLFTNKTDLVLRSDTRTISPLSYSLKVLCNSTKWEAKVVSCTCLHEWEGVVVDLFFEHVVFRFLRTALEWTLI